MAQEFEGDLIESVFWGADLTGSMFRDVNFTGVRMTSVWLTDVEIDGLIDRLVVNGVDVTDYVAAHDPWQPLRGMLRPADVAGMRTTWAELQRVWAELIEQAGRLTDAQRHERVGGEWSFAETLRHLVFGIDKWYTVPLAGGSFHPLGVPNSGSASRPWPGLDPSAAPTYAEVLAAYADRTRLVGGYLGSLADSELERTVEIIENGMETVAASVYTVIEEAFEHRRYALRDLAALT
jgi:uncharacterized damage-inducible protein DinB